VRHSTRSRLAMVIVIIVAGLSTGQAEADGQNQAPVFRSGADSIEVIAFAADRKGLALVAPRHRDFIPGDRGVRAQRQARPCRSAVPAGNARAVAL